MMSFSTALPDNTHVPADMTWALATADPSRIEHGWWGNPENGAMREFQAFYQAYRSLPAVPFTRVPGTNDPVMVRQYKSMTLDSGWFYLANTQNFSSKTTIRFAVTPQTIVDAINSCPQGIQNNELEIETGPYQVKCYQVKGSFDIAAAESTIPHIVGLELANTVVALEAGAEMLPSSEATALVEAAKNMLKEKRFSTLFYLTRSFSARKHC